MKCITGYLAVISCAFLFNSCDMHEEKPIVHTIYEISIINSDGSGYRRITEGYGARILKKKNKILFSLQSNWQSNLWSANFDGTGSKKNN